MVASNSTVAQILRVVQRHVDRETAIAIISDLKGEVKGNASVLQTLQRMHERLLGLNNEKKRE